MSDIIIMWKGEMLDTPTMGIHYNSVTVNRKYNTPSQPLEDGTPIIDHKVRLPIEVTVSVCVKAEKIKTCKSKLAEMCDAELSPTNTADVVDRTGTKYSNLVLIDFTHVDNNSDKFNNFYFDLKFKEVMFSDNSVGDSEVTMDDENGSTVVI